MAIEDDADRVGELRAVRQHRMNGAPGELAMADFAASGPRHTASFADRVGREIVVQHEGLFISSLQRIDILLVFAGAERRHHQCLGLAAGEQRAAMRARQDSHLAHDRAHGLQVAAVDAVSGLEDGATHHIFFRVLERSRNFRRERAVVIRRDQGLDELVLDRGNAVAAILLDRDLIGLAELG